MDLLPAGQPNSGSDNVLTNVGNAGAVTHFTTGGVSFGTGATNPSYPEFNVWSTVGKLQCVTQSLLITRNLLHYILAPQLFIATAPATSFTTLYPISGWVFGVNDGSFCAASQTE
jgi:hypothetical protein